MFRGLAPLLVVHDFRHVLVHHAGFEVFDRQDVAIAHHEIDIVQRDALGVEAVVHDLLKESGVVFLARDPLLVDGDRDFAIAKKAGAHVVVVRIDAEYVYGLCVHRICF